MGQPFDLFFLFIAVIICLVVAQALLQRQEISTLRHSGTRVVATVTNVTHERHQTGGGVPMNPATPGVMQPATYVDHWYIEAEWLDPKTGVLHTFRSVPQDEDDARRYTAGSPITVLIDPVNPASYYVEIAR
ncbi:MAG: hypothetical protein OJF49_004375 [Ktedonobacterales bacterium]|nr:MAG: hypothetical protein OJF49_004375 [Ktedonobacterales bacterium]